MKGEGLLEAMQGQSPSCFSMPGWDFGGIIFFVHPNPVLLMTKPSDVGKAWKGSHPHLGALFPPLTQGDGQKGKRPVNKGTQIQGLSVSIHTQAKRHCPHQWIFKLQHWPIRLQKSQIMKKDGWLDWIFEAWTALEARYRQDELSLGAKLEEAGVLRAGGPLISQIRYRLGGMWH